MAVTILRRGVNGNSPSSMDLSGTVGSLITVLDFCLVTTLGWSKVFSGSSLAVYRAPTGNRFYLRVDDTGAQQARIVAYESMTDVNTGTSAFPTEGQMSGGLYHYKSSAASSAARPWYFASDGKMFHFLSSPDAALTNFVGFSFGDFESYKAGDAYNTILLSANAANQVGQGLLMVNTAINASPVVGHYVPRSHTQIGASIAVGKLVDYAYSFGSGSLSGSGVSYPAPLEGGLILMPVRLYEQNIGVRGRLPGVWSAGHTKPLATGDTFSGTGALAGRNFEAITLYGNSGQAMIETSDTWSTF